MPSENISPRRLAAILFADIVGYTAMMQSDEGKAMNKLRHYQTVLKGAMSEHKGEIIKNYGDGSLCLFTSVLDAVQCAKALQETFRNEPVIPLRIGLHLGDVMYEENDIYGNAINVASRIESMGISGSVLMSKDIQKKINNQRNLRCESLGRFEFKNVEEPMEVFALANDGFPIPKQEEIQGKFKPSESKDGFLQRLWNKKVPQLLAAYLVIGWAIVQMSDWGLQQFGISHHWSRMLYVVVIGIIPSVIVYLNNRTQIHNKIFTRKQKILFPTNILILGAALFFMFRSVDLGATSKNVIITNADGIEESRSIIKEEFQIHTSIFNFEQIGEDTTNAWMSIGLCTSLGHDIEQDKYIKMQKHQDPKLSTGDKINIAKFDNGDYYVDGKYQYADDVFSITPTIRNKHNGKIAFERAFVGDDYYKLIDSISNYVKLSIGLSLAQIEESIDLDYGEWTTRNLEATKYFILARTERHRENLAKAIALDPSFALASLYLALSHHVNSGGVREAKLNIEGAMRHRNKLPFVDQMEIKVLSHLIKEEWEIAEKLLKMQLEIAPNSDELNNQLLDVYWQTWQIDNIIEHAEDRFAKDPSPLTAYFAGVAGFMNGEPDKVIRLIKGFLVLDSQNIMALSFLAEAYLQKGDYDEVRKTVEKIILIDPDSETSISYLLLAANFMEANKDYAKILPKLAGLYSNEGSRQTAINRIVNNNIINKANNQFGKFMYPIAENSLISANQNFTHLKVFQSNKDGEFDVTVNSNIRADTTTNYYTWKQDSLISNAEKLLRNKEYEKAIIAYNTAIEKHPSHYYLPQAIKHIEFVKSKSNEDLLKIYQRHTGQYGKVNITMEDNHLNMKQVGFGTTELLPISSTQYISVQGYQYLFDFEEKNGKVDAFQEYWYDHELKTWKRAEDWYFKRNKILD